MGIRFELWQSTSWKEARRLADEYFEYLGSLNDGFWDVNLYQSIPCLIVKDSEVVGFYSVMTWYDGIKTMTSFYLKPPYRRFGRALLERAVKLRDIGLMLVPTNDGQYMSLAFDLMHDLDAWYDMQAYNLTPGKPLRPAEISKKLYQRVSPSEYERMNADTENEWKDMTACQGTRFYRAVQDGVTLGYGSMLPHSFRPQVMDIGNYTLKEHRQKGVGRSTIINLTEIANAEGYATTVGCWYYNQESIATLTSAGYVPQARLYRIILGEKRPEAR